MIIRNLLYIYQAEGYNNARFLNYVYHNLKWYDLQKRGRLDWTKKASLIYVLTLIIFFGILVLGWTIFKFKIFVAIFLGEILLLPLIIILSGVMVSPIDLFLKNKIKSEAQQFLSLARNLKVIGITGSYGKTTTKDILASVLSQHFKIVKTPENINTDIGIANFILKNKKVLTEANYFIVEMGAYKIGDIKEICNIVLPSYSILTGINTAHIERFGSLDNTIKAKFELLQNTTGTKYLNIDDKNILGNYQKFFLDKVDTFSVNEATQVLPLDDFKGMSFVYGGEKFEISLVAKHVVGLTIGVIKLALELGMDYKKIKLGLTHLETPDHRLKIIRNREKNIIIIDDSYNGNYDGFLSGLEVLSRAKGRKVILTPGLVEQGSGSAEIHQSIGKLYAQTADLVLLIDNSSTVEIAKGLKMVGFNKVKHYQTVKAAHDDLGKILEAGDTIIFQNDWSDAYL